MLEALWIAAGVGFTVYCIIMQAPTWVIVLNVSLDVLGILMYLKGKK